MIPIRAPDGLTSSLLSSATSSVRSTTSSLNGSLDTSLTSSFSSKESAVAFLSKQKNINPNHYQVVPTYTDRQLSRGARTQSYKIKPIPGTIEGQFRPVGS